MLKDEERLVRWKQFVENVDHSEALENARKAGVSHEILDHLRTLFFDAEPRPVVKKALGSRGKRVLAILGTVDDKVSREATRRLEAHGRIELIAGMDHQAFEEPQFHAHFWQIIDFISSFIEAPDTTPPGQAEARHAIVEVFGTLGTPPASGQALWEGVASLPAVATKEATKALMQLSARYHSADELAEAVRRDLAKR